MAMSNRINLIFQLDNLQRFLRNYNPEFFDKALNKEAYADILADAIALLKEQENDIHHMGLIIDEYEKELNK
jgi:hypothetical protein